MPHVDAIAAEPSPAVYTPLTLFRALVAEAANGVPAVEPRVLQSWVDATIDALFERAA